MDIHEDIAVKLPYWKWVYFLGWIEAKLPFEPTDVLDDVRTAIESNVRP